MKWLVRRIEALALPEEAAKARAEAPGLPPSEFTMFLDPVMVINSEPISGSDRRRREIFMPVKQEPTEGERASFRRSTTVTLDLQLVAGELLADTLLKRPVPETSPNSTSGRVGTGGAAPETTKAAGPGSHNGLLSAQPAPARKRVQTAPLNKVKSIAQQGGKQTASKPDARGSQVRRQPATAKG